jgi:inorganic triphosphatase YgiF
MPVETELKLRIAPEQLAKLKRHALLKSHLLTRPTTRRLYNIYFDTPKLELQQSGMALRLRRSGRQWLQTLKGGGSVLGGLHQRNEWEMPVSGPALDFSLPQVAEWKEILPKHLRKQLQPVFVTDFSRNSRILEWQGAQIELCMDQGEVSTEITNAPICELELELISGEAQQLFGLALAILDIVPFELESISKAEQGFRLMAGYTEQPVKALPSHLDKHDDLSKAMQALIWSCLQHFQSNLRGGIANGDAEYLHQMRVALRRLRVLLRMAEKVCADEQLAAFRQEITAIGHMLGRIREWDVFIAQTVQPMCDRMPDDAGLQALLSSSKQQRNASYSALRNDELARDLQCLLLRFAIWMYGPYWQRHELTGLHARDFAALYLPELARRFEKAGKHLNTFDAVQLHAMRIRAKKLRYSVEFFASLYGKQKYRQYLATLGEVQEVFGQINDDAVAQRLLDELSVTRTLSGHQDATGLVKGWLAHDLAGRLIVLKDAVQNFCRQHRYGEK